MRQFSRLHQALAFSSILQLATLLANGAEARDLRKALLPAAHPSSSPSPSPTPAPLPPSIQSLLKPEIFQRVLKSREIIAHASLDKDPASRSDPPLKTYSFYAAMLTQAGLTRTRQVLTDYQLYSRLIPYIDEATYHPQSHLLDLKGGIWKWKLASYLRFDERSDRWIHFEVVGGHFTGLVGDIYFEPSPTQGTLVYMRGLQQGYRWPPAFIIEQGAQIVFEFTAKRMRSYIDESSSGRTTIQAAPKSQGNVNDGQIPQPRSHL